jgi:hypothetical protein
MKTFKQFQKKVKKLKVKPQPADPYKEVSVDKPPFVAYNVREAK